jgi:Uma2 family endonuclease
MIKAPLESAEVLSGPFFLDFRAVEMTDEQFLQFCADNGDLRFELTAKKELIVMPPAGLGSGWRELRVGRRLDTWAEEDGTGMAYGPSAGFRLPNGAVRAPDASWLRLSRRDGLTEDERERIAPICPDFVLEIRSPSDSLAVVQAKMQEYMENGARLGWLIDPFQRRVHVYRPGQAAEVLEDPATVAGEDVLPGFDLNLSEIWD